MNFTWTASTGCRLPDSSQTERVLRLHKLLFVEKQGKRVGELVEARKEEGQKADVDRTRTHKGRLKELNDRMDMKLKNCLEYGSTSIWTQKERDAIEEARQDPEEAKEAMAKKLREQGKSYSDQRGTMRKRVTAMPALNIRPKEEWAAIEEMRTDPKEALDGMTRFMRTQERAYREQKSSMGKRVASMPALNIRPKAEWDRIEEARQDPEEAKEAMTKFMNEQARGYRDQVWAMDERVERIPDMSRWTKEQRAEIEEARQDPEEAKESMTKYMRKIADSYADTRKKMEKRVKARPDMSRWSKSEWATIEEARQDPDEAGEAARKFMKEQAKTYSENKKAMMQSLEKESQEWGGWSRKAPRGSQTTTARLP